MMTCFYKRALFTSAIIHIAWKARKAWKSGESADAWSTEYLRPWVNKINDCTPKFIQQNLIAGSVSHSLMKRSEGKINKQHEATARFHKEFMAHFLPNVYQV